MHEIYALVAGTLYGLLIGIIPSGATTGLVALFGFISYFVDQPYLGVIFCIGSWQHQQQVTLIQEFFLEYPAQTVLPLTMVDGFPLAQKRSSNLCYNCRSDNKHREWFTMGNSYLCTITLVHKPVNDLGYTRTMGIYSACTCHRWFCVEYLVGA